MAASVHSRTLLKAAELLGGRAQLSRELKVPMSDLEKWIADKAVPPNGIFLRAVDIVLSESATPQSDSDSTEPSAPRDCSASDPASLY